MTSQRKSLGTVRVTLIALFALVGLAMFSATVYASLDRSVWNIGDTLLSDRWFQATLLDTYLAFGTFYAWVYYKESTWAGRVLWLIAIVCLGSMAIAAYMVWQLLRWNPATGAGGLLLRTNG